MVLWLLTIQPWAAVSEVIQNNGQKEILLLSLGTGIPKAQNKLNDPFDALCQLSWLAGHLEVIGEAISSTDMTHYYLATIFPGLLSGDNYLRIEEYNLDPSMKEMDYTDQDNMDGLEMVGKDLLTQKVKRIDVNTFQPFQLDNTNVQALDRLATKLYGQLRLKRKSVEKGGRPFIETI